MTRRSTLTDVNTEQKSTSFSLSHFVEKTSPVDGDTAKLELAKAEAKVKYERLAVT